MPLPTPHLPKTENDALRTRAEALHLHGLLTHWSEVATQPWLAPMLDWEEQQRARRSLERRLSAAHIGRFKPLCDFDWSWPNPHFSPNQVHWGADFERILLQPRFSRIHRKPQCQQSVTPPCLTFQPSKAALWWRASMAARSPRTPARCCWARPIAPFG